MSSQLAPSSPEDRPLQPGSPEMPGLRLAMFLCGFCSVSVLHGTQPLLPELATYFDVTSSTASWALSATMLALALMLLPAGLLSDRFGRRGFLLGGLGLASLATVAAALAPRFVDLLFWRTLTGLVLAGVPAIALAYLTEEVAPGFVGRSIALYAAGNALGGVSGRLMA
ncbi:MAG TPA: MFS transporter, partial [Halieaceae bacterium]|nr:MFS transporter [Halieaceae bacterium]